MFTLATVLLLAGLLVWVLGDIVFKDTTGTYQSYFHYLFIASIAMYILGIIVKVFSRVIKPYTKNRCIRCGTPVPKGHVYCVTHERDVVDETRESLEETWSKAKKGKK